MEEFSGTASKSERETIRELEKANIPETREEKRECFRECVDDPWEMKSEKVCHEACKF